MAEQEFYTAIGTDIEAAVQSQMFGKSCFKLNGKAFICFFQNSIVCKLTGIIHQDALNLEGSILFDPSGKKRPMKEWVQIPYAHKEQWKHFALEALKYVAGQ